MDVVPSINIDHIYTIVTHQRGSFRISGIALVFLMESLNTKDPCWALKQFLDSKLPMPKYISPEDDYKELAEEKIVSLENRIADYLFDKTSKSVVSKKVCQKKSWIRKILKKLKTLMNLF